MTNVQCSAVQRPSVSAARTTEGFVTRLSRLPLAIIETLLIWQERARQRHHLASLDDRLLSDMGLSRADAERESAVPFWRVS
jgi:uncharacterized protein YjiS (DUF1127 family)